MRLSSFINPVGHSAHLTLFLCLLLAGFALPARAQTNVTIPKSRLEELEKKEAELEKLRNQLNPPKPVQAGQPVVQATNAPVTGQAPSPAPTAVPAPPPVSPLLSPLPALKEGEVVSAIDLAAHYRQDRAAADQRYRKQSFAVQGEIERFEKRAFARSYSLIMKTGGSDLKVICEVYPPEPYTAVYTATHGSEVVGMYRDDKEVLARADSIAVARGECKGLEGSVIVLKGCALKSVRPIKN